MKTERMGPNNTAETNSGLTTAKTVHRWLPGLAPGTMGLSQSNRANGGYRLATLATGKAVRMLRKASGNLANNLGIVFCLDPGGCVQSRSGSL